MTPALRAHDYGTVTKARYPDGQALQGSCCNQVWPIAGGGYHCTTCGRDWPVTVGEPRENVAVEGAA